MNYKTYDNRYMPDAISLIQSLSIKLTEKNLIIF